MLQRRIIVENGQFFSSRRKLVKATAAGAAVGAAGAAGRQPHSPKHVQDLSILLLVNKNLQNQLGRGLVDHHQLIHACQLVDDADYALVVIGGDSGSSSSGASSSSSNYFVQTCPVSRPVLYANRAAVAAFTSTGDTQQPTSSTGSSSGAAGLQDPPQLQQLYLPADIFTFLQQQQSAGTGSSSRTQHNSCGSTVLQDVTWQYNAAVQQQYNAAVQQPDKVLTIKQLLCCHVCAPNGARLGVAVLFDEWQHADGCLGLPGWPYVDPDALPTQQQLEQAAAAVRGQADTVRQLKQVQGLGNQDAAVVEAVAALQSLKQQLAQAEGLREAFNTARQGTLQQLLLQRVEQQQQEGQQQQQQQ